MNQASEPQSQAKEHPDLYRKTIRGGVWLMGERAILQVFSVVRLFVLARLLPPREFGILGIAMLLMGLLETFTQTGFTTALVQRKEEDVHPYLNTAWTVNVLRGVALFLIFNLAAPVAIQFFDGDGSFRSSDFQKPYALAARLQDPDNTLGSYLMGRLPEPLRRQVETITAESVTADEARESLRQTFLELVSRETLYQQEAFAGISFSPYAEKCLSSLTPDTRQRTHRLLLEQAWPDLIQRSVLDRPQLLLIIRVIGFILLLRAFGNTAVVYFTKTLRFEKNAAIHIGATAVNVTATIVLAIALKSVWALVWGLLLAECTTLALSYYMQPWRPRFELDRARLRQMWRFGRWITGLSMMEFLLTTGDSVLVGRLLGATSLGLYQMSNRLSSLPINEFTTVIARASFPAFCRIQSDIVRLREAFLKTVDLTSAFVMPAVGGILLFSDDIVYLFMQESWQPLVSTLRIMALLGLFRTISLGSVLHALGKPHYLTIFMGIRISLIAMLFYPLTQDFGLDGMAWVMTLSGLLLIVPGYLFLARLLQCRVVDILRHQAAQAGGVLLMLTVVGAVKLWWWTEPTYLRFFVLAAAAVVIYGKTCLMLTAVFKAQWLSFLKERWQQFKGLVDTKI